MKHCALACVHSIFEACIPGLGLCDFVRASADSILPQSDSVRASCSELVGMGGLHTMHSWFGSMIGSARFLTHVGST